MRHFAAFAVLALIFIISSSASWASNSRHYGKANVSLVTAVLDGDTFQANIRNWPPIVGRRISVRISKIDAPELNGRCAYEKRLAHQAKQMITSELKKAAHIELRNIKRDKYFRLNAEVFVDDKNLGELLIKAKLAKRYNNGRKPNWC